jgi:sugar (pentulose or hexulose) kinase
MERACPEAFATAQWYLGVPQYWAWRLTGRAASEASYLGAQSHLWNVPGRRWAFIVGPRRWERLLPPLVPAWAELGTVRPELARRFGLSPGLRVHAGVHDSTANAYRYAAAGRGDLLVVSTGTWIVGFAGGVPVERLDEAAGMTLNADVHGRPVGGALTMGGRAFAALAGEQDGRAADLAVVAALVARGTMALPTFGDHAGQFPGTDGRGRIIGPPPEGPAERLALAVLHVALLTLALIERLDPERPVMLDGSYLRELLFAGLVGALRPGRETLVSEEPYGIAAGAALLTGHAAREAAVAVPLRPAVPAEVPGLLSYARRWAGLAAERTVP